MTVFRNKQRGGRWSFDFWSDSQRYTGYCIDPETGKEATSKSEAKELEALEKRRVKALNGAARNGNRPGSFSLLQAMMLHLDSLAGASPVYVANQKMYAREILKWFGQDLPMVEVTTAKADEYRAWALEQPLRIWKGGTAKKRDRRDPKWWGEGKKKRSAVSVNHYLRCLRSGLAQAHKAKDPVTGMPMLPFPPEVKSAKEPKRTPRPMPDGELAKRLEKAKPWVRDAADLARAFGLRKAEALTVTLDNIDPEHRGLRFGAEEVKSDRDEYAYGGEEGWALLKRLAAQARRRGVRHLVTWPGPKHWKAVLRDEPPDGLTWIPLKSIRRAWQTTAKNLKIKGVKVTRPHRFHDLRARFITEVAKVAPTAVTQQAARHADPATTARYTGIASLEVAEAV